MSDPVTCEGCGADLTTTTNCEGWRMVLASEPIPSVDGVVTAMAEYPPVKKPLRFCDWPCFEKWLEKRSSSRSDE